MMQFRLVGAYFSRSSRLNINESHLMYQSNRSLMMMPYFLKYLAPILNHLLVNLYIRVRFLFIVERILVEFSKKPSRVEQQVSKSNWNGFKLLY